MPIVQQLFSFSTPNRGNPTTSDKSLSARFIERAREKRAKGEDYAHWVKAARIVHHINLDMMPRYRRKRPRRRKGVAR